MLSYRAPDECYDRYGIPVKDQATLSDVEIDSITNLHPIIELKSKGRELYFWDNSIPRKPVLLFALFRRNSDGLISEILAGDNKEILSYWLRKMPADIRKKLLTLFAGVQISVPSLDDDRIFKFEEQYKKTIKFHETCNKNVVRPYSGNFPYSQSAYILVAQIGFTDGISEKPILITSGAMPCILVAVFNSATKSAALAHVAPEQNISNLKDHILKMRDDPKEKLLISLCGGNQNGLPFAISLVDMVLTLPNVELNSLNLFSNVDRVVGGCLSIDARTGETFNHFDDVKLPDYVIIAQVDAQRMASKDGFLLKGFDGREKKNNVIPQPPPALGKLSPP